MESWQIDIQFGNFVLDFTYISVLFIIATVLRRYVPFLQKFLVPNNVVAGFIGFLIAAININYFDGISSRMGTYVYHLLALTFIAVGLSQRKSDFSRAPVVTGILLVTVYLIQGIIGLLVTFGFYYTVMPDLFPSFGLLMPLSFGMGPGISYSIALNWENYGFEDGGITGLTISAVGFMIAYIPGILILKKGIRDGKAYFIKNGGEIGEELKKGLMKPDNHPIAGRMTTSVEAIEPFTFHLALVGLTYAFTMGFLKLFELLLIEVGAGSEVNTLWSFHFIFATIIAIVVRNIIDQSGLHYLVDSGVMTRTANLFMDFMVTASITAISFAVIAHYLFPILVMSTIAGFFTYYFIKWSTYKYFNNYYFERFISLFGDMTGTIQSALVLLRVLDPGFKSRAGIDLVYGSGIALFIGFPLLLLINAPVTFFDDVALGNWYVLFTMAAYLVLLLLLLGLLQRWKSD
mgnify:CR=1 FL=1